jgi:hypothetical protein
MENVRAAEGVSLTHPDAVDVTASTINNLIEPATDSFSTWDFDPYSLEILYCPQLSLLLTFK